MKIKRQRDLMGYTGGNLVAQGGIESVMPKPQGETSDPVALEVIRRNKAGRWVVELERKALFIQKRIPFITDEREKAILECMLDGLSMVAIGRHMGLSERHIRRLKDSIVSKMSGMPSLPNKSDSCVLKNACVNLEVGRRGSVDLLKLDYVMRHPCGGSLKKNGAEWIYY